LQLRQFVQPDRVTVFVNETAAVDGYGHLEAIVEPGGDASQIAAPTDPRDSNPFTIDAVARGQQRMGAEYVGHGVVGPHLPGLVVLEGAEDDRVRKLRPTV